MKRYEVRLAARAIQRLEEIEDRLFSEHYSDVAAEWFGRLLDGIEGLATGPERFPVAEEGEFFSPPLRKLLVLPHRVLYQVIEERNVVYVVTIRHVRQRWLEGTEP